MKKKLKHYYIFIANVIFFVSLIIFVLYGIIAKEKISALHVLLYMVFFSVIFLTIVTLYLNKCSQIDYEDSRKNFEDLNERILQLEEIKYKSYFTFTNTKFINIYSLKYTYQSYDKTKLYLESNYALNTENKVLCFDVYNSSSNQIKIINLNKFKIFKDEEVIFESFGCFDNNTATLLEPKKDFAIMLSVPNIDLTDCRLAVHLNVSSITNMITKQTIIVDLYKQIDANDDIISYRSFVHEDIL